MFRATASRSVPFSMTRVLRFVLVAGGCFALSASQPAGAQDRYTIIDLGTLGGDVSAFSVNASGQVAGQSNNHAFGWDVSGYPPMQDLSTLGGNTSIANGINAFGGIAGTSELPGGRSHAFRYDTARGMVDLGIEVQSFGYAINASGIVVGYAIDDMNIRRAFREPGGFLNPFSNRNVQAYGINDRGDVVGTFTTPAGDGGHAFLTPFDQEHLDPARDDLGTLGGRDSVARGVNVTGEVVGYSVTSAGPTHAFLAFPSSQVMQDLNTLGGTTSQAFGINASRQVVGYSTTASGQRHAFLWRDGTMTDLNEKIPDQSGWVLTEARGITDGGLIVGQGTNPDGQSHAVLLAPHIAMLVHGTWSNSRMPWAEMKPALGAVGYLSVAIDYNLEPETRSNESSPIFQAGALARRITDLLKNNPDGTIDLVCHSLGGLGGRWYLNHETDPFTDQPLWPKDSGGRPHAGVRDAILLGTPNWGTETLGTNPAFMVAVAHFEGIDAAFQVHGGSYPSDTINNWSVAVRDMYAEWMPPPTLAGEWAYPLGFKLAQWPQSDVFRSPITNGSLDLTIDLRDILLAQGYTFAADSIQLGLDRFNISEDDRFLTHVEYYEQQKVLLGQQFFPSGGEEGVDTRRISRFLYDLNVGSIDVSGAQIYLVAGNKNIVIPYLLPGAYSVPADGIVPVDSALGNEPISGIPLYPQALNRTFDASHTELPHRADVIDQILNWLIPVSDRVLR